MKAAHLPANAEPQLGQDIVWAREQPSDMTQYLDKLRAVRARVTSGSLTESLSTAMERNRLEFAKYLYDNDIISDYHWKP